MYSYKNGEQIDVLI